MPAHSRGAVAARGRLLGMCSANLRCGGAGGAAGQFSAHRHLNQCNPDTSSAPEKPPHPTSPPLHPLTSC